MKQTTTQNATLDGPGLRSGGFGNQGEAVIACGIQSDFKFELCISPKKYGHGQGCPTQNAHINT